MKRLFAKSVKTESESRKDENNKETEEGSDNEESKRSPHGRRKSLAGKEDMGEGDAGKSSRRRRHEKVGAVSKTRNTPPSTEHRRRKPPHNLSMNGESEEETPKPRPKPRQRSTLTNMEGPSPIAELSDSDKEILAVEDYKEDSPDPDYPHSPLQETKRREKVPKVQQRQQLPSFRGVSDVTNDSSEEILHFIKKEDLPPLPKVEPGKGSQFLSSSYSYRVPLSSFKVRARLLKYPTITDKGMWQGDMAVIDDRVFLWQEKVFSKAEVKRFQKKENCITEQERKYHEEIMTNPNSIGKSLYSFVSDDPYVLRKSLKLLSRNCPVPHSRIAKAISQVSTNGKSLNFDGESLDDEYFSEDFDIDEPVSSSTPKSKRKNVEKSTKAVSEITKMERKMRNKKEKELKDLEKRDLRLKQLQEKQDLEEMRRNEQEDEKIRKIEAIEREEWERKQVYMKKYKYSRRPSLALGARMRSVQMTPSPSNKSRRKQKLLSASRSSEQSTDYPENEKGSSEFIKDDHGERAQSESDTGSRKFKESKRIARKVGHERDDSNYKREQSHKAVSAKGKGKFYERFSSKTGETMYIMASVPYLPGKYHEVVVCMIRNIPRQRVMLFKPSIGYRNIEVKRNQLFRVSCELPTAEAKVRQPYRSYFGKENAMGSGIPSSAKIKADASYGEIFELTPKSEMRLTVMGEITTAEGFDASPINIYYLVDIPKGWRNDSLLSHTEGITHSCFTDDRGVAHFSHEFSFHLVFSMDILENSDTFPTPTIALLAVSMNNPSPRIVYEGYGYVTIPMTPGTHFAKIRMWKPKPRTIVEKLQAAFLDITPSLQDIKFVHMSFSENEVGKKANLLGFQTESSGTVKLRLNVIHQTPVNFKGHDAKLDLLEKMSSATILRSVQAVIEAFQRARQKVVSLKSQYP